MKLKINRFILLRFLCGLALCVCGISCAAMSQESIKVTNVHFEAQDSVVKIMYDFIGDKEDEYKIVLILKKENDPSYAYEPKETRGDVGTGHFAGPHRQIVWTAAGAFVPGLKDGQYFFDLRVERLSSMFNPTLWIGAGVVVLGVVAGVHFLGSPDNGAPADAHGFPSPPGRPE